MTPGPLFDLSEVEIVDVEVVHFVQESVDRRAGDDGVVRVQQDRLPQLMVKELSIDSTAHCGARI